VNARGGALAPVGARSATGRRHYGLGWLPWVALALLVALVIAAALIIANVSDENDAPGVDLQDNEVNNDTLTPLWGDSLSA
jgi:hypothetical protein